ncbi:hypothetical protein UFOVP507_39 [uncultured Caudovirales phage]|uniref:Uncharacterized protein n=1 Tax=uncultured Caudovirales phage TaxID=2100421 RepID=A0A6J5MRD7_9CAUD|nr:hypothetical protein UFOVP507_39 [uncultured Caudovirales phage]
MKIEPKQNCPLDGFNPCRQLECAWFMKVQGKNPNTGEEIEDWACSMAWIPMLLIENSQQQRQTGGAIESFRNEMVKANDMSQKVLLASAGILPKETLIIQD